MSPRMPSPLVAAIAALLACLSSCGRAPATIDDPLIVSQSDPIVARFEAAEAEAIRTLPIFWKKFEAREAGVDGYIVKVVLPTDAAGGKEALWLSIKERLPNGNVVGILINNPIGAAGPPIRSTVEAPEKDIVDWSYRRDGKSYGEFSTRVMLERASSEQRAKALPALSTTPLEIQ